MRHVGIDPGVSGAIVVLEGGDVTCHRMPPDVDSLWLLLAGLEPAFAVLEKVHAGPSMGSSAAFKFGRGIGCLQMGLRAAGLEYERVTPQAWQKEMGLPRIGGGFGVKDKEKKQRNKDAAASLFPEIKVFHWNADALLIASYARRRYEVFLQEKIEKREFPF